jgi:hypothetical protein
VSKAKRRKRDNARYKKNPWKNPKWLADAAARYAADPEYREFIKARNAAWHAANQGSSRARVARRRAKKLRATPSWLSSEMLGEMEDLYEIAGMLSVLIGMPYEVDHIVPLINEHVCGLHVPWNMKVVTRYDNRSKQNKLPGEDEFLATNRFEQSLIG